MIRLGRIPGPDLAGDPRIVEARQRLFAYLRRPPSERAERRAPVDERIFYDQRIFDAVMRRSHGKCMFCERRGDGDEVVDHFRPLRDARDLYGDVDPDFYAWLAYEFQNMLLMCRECVHRKGTVFPVVGERAPYIAGMAEVQRREVPVLLDPYRDQVDQHFDFLCDGWCEPLGFRAQFTLSLLGLNRERLVAERTQEIAVFMEELQSVLFSSRGPESIRYLLLPRRVFAGAKLNILRRLLRGLTFGGQAIGGQATTLAARFDIAMRGGVSEAEMRRLHQRLDELPGIDRERERWDGQLGLPAKPVPPVPVSPWANVQRSGGLSHIEIDDFRGIEKLRLRIPTRPKSRAAACLMILGENAVGKSSILQGVALALLGAHEARSLRLDADDFLRSPFGDRWDQLSPKDARVHLGFRFDQRADFALNARRRIVGDGPVSAIVLGYGPRRFFNPRKSGRGVRANERVRTLFRQTATIPYPGTWLNELTDDRFAEVAQVIRIVLALSDDDQLVRDIDGRICVNLEGRPVPLEWLSEGYRSVFVMVADIVRELMPRFPILEDAEAIVLIDEIETHLHPRWKMRVMSALRRALPNVQFIVTTHDPLCLRGMEDGEVAVLQRSQTGELSVLSGLPSVKGMRADQLLTSDYFGLSSTIDPESELDMAQYVRAVGAGTADGLVEAEQLVAHITIGDDAQEQVIHRAMREFIEKRERPTDELRPDLSEKAVKAVLSALEADFE